MSDIKNSQEELRRLVKVYDDAIADDGEYGTEETAAAVVKAEEAIHQWHEQRTKMGEWYGDA